MQNNEAQVEDNSNACRAFLPQRALPYMWSLWVQQVKGQNVFNFQSCSIWAARTSLWNFQAFFFFWHLVNNIICSQMHVGFA